MLLQQILTQQGIGHREEGYVNLCQMAELYQEDLDEWLQADRMQECFTDFLSEYPQKDPIINSKDGTLWMHPTIALWVAQKWDRNLAVRLSRAFAITVSETRLQTEHDFTQPQ